MDYVFDVTFYLIIGLMYLVIELHLLFNPLQPTGPLGKKLESYLEKRYDL